MLIVGLGVGLFVGAVIVRRVDRAAKALTPASLGRKAGRGAVTLRHRLGDAWTETKAAAAEREAELRAEFDVPSVRALRRD